ncbi:hypothetical protein [Virgisporangium aliadipatigenens]|nr:hypothetical protein [Virgisporangium aliadipatigenens]
MRDRRAALLAAIVLGSPGGQPLRGPDSDETRPAERPEAATAPAPPRR